LGRFWRIHFRCFSCSNSRFVIYSYNAVFTILRSYGISAVLFRGFFIYLALYGDTLLSLHSVRKYGIFFMTYKEVIHYAKH